MKPIRNAKTETITPEIFVAKAEARVLNTRVWLGAILLFIVVAFVVCAWFKDPEKGVQVLGLIRWPFVILELALLGSPSKMLELASKWSRH
jgi:hypothetical protein